MEININTLWTASKLPVIDGIFYADGNYQKLEIITDQNFHRKLIPVPELTPDISIISDISVTAEYDFQNYHIFCGESSYGGDGFVTAVSSESNQIAWFAFWEEANPFIKIRSHETKLEITNNLHEVWQFDLSDSKSVKIAIKEDL